QSFHRRLVGHVGFHKAEVLAGDGLDAGQSLGAGVVVVVRHDDVVAGLQKFDAGMAADVSGAAADQNCHRTRSFFLFVFLLPQKPWSAVGTGWFFRRRSDFLSLLPWVSRCFCFYSTSLPGFITWTF